jgi:hypothetical protein
MTRHLTRQRAASIDEGAEMDSAGDQRASPDEE